MCDLEVLLEQQLQERQMREGLPRGVGAPRGPTYYSPRADSPVSFTFRKELHLRVPHLSIYLS